MLGIGLITYNRLAALQGCVKALEKYTQSPYHLLIADDGSTDGTLEWARAKGYRIVTGQNMGSAWNKNRALYYLMSQTECDPLLLLEDDCWPQFHGWDLHWLQAAQGFGHVNYVTWQETPLEAIIAGAGTPQDPMRSIFFAGTCTVSSRAAIDQVGYLDTRFQGYGYGHVEWTWRMGRYFRHKLWIEPDPTRAQHTFPVLQIGVDLIDFGTFRNSQQMHHNRRTFDLVNAELVNAELVRRGAFRNPPEKAQLERELSILIAQPALTTLTEISPATSLCPQPQQWHMFDAASAEVEALEFMTNLVKLLKPEFSVETGSGYGWSAWHIGQGLAENGCGRLVSLEVNQILVAQARRLCSNMNQVEIRHGAALEYEPLYPVDLLVLASSMRLKSAELKHFLPLLSPRAIIVIHDTAPYKGEPRVELETLEQCGLIKAVHLPTPRGLTIAQAR